MMNLRDLWYTLLFDLIAEAEAQTMKQKNYLGFVKQLEMARVRILQLVSEEEKALCEKQLDIMEACFWDMYNELIKNVVIAVEFKEIDL